jgi:tetratricopeptide (TPR) repeat protein
MQRHARRVEALCAGLDASDQLVTALFLSARSRMVRGEMRAAMRIFDRVRSLAGGIREPYLRAAVYSEVASLLSLSVRLAEGDHIFDLCVESYAQAGPKPVASFTLDPLVCAHFGKALREWLRGRRGSARRSLDDGIEHADFLGQPFSQAFIRLYGGGIALLSGDAERARELVARGARLASGVDSIGLLAFANVLEPALEPVSPVASDRVMRMEKALRDHEQAGHRGMRSLGIAELARVLEEEGRPEEALVVLVSATSEAARGEDVFLLSEMLRRRGELLARLGRVDEAAATLRRSLKVARRGGASGLELRAALSLARLLVAEGRSAAARRALDAMLARLPGDVDTPERAEAVVLRDGLAGGI